MSFTKLGLLTPLLTNLNTLGFAQPTDVQAKVIPSVLAGRDLLATAQTGSGKTAAFMLPLLHLLLTSGARVQANQVRCLVLAPTRELAEQIFQATQSFAQNLPIRSAVAYGGVSINPQMQKLRKGVDILIATPGRLLDLHQQNAVKFAGLAYLVLDEADRMLDLGFAQEINQLLRVIPRRKQTLLFSATISQRVEQLIKVLLNNPARFSVNPVNQAVNSVTQKIYTTDKKDKVALFLHLREQQNWQQAMVFVKTKKSAEQIAQLLQKHGLSADSIHGDKPQASRLKALEMFKQGKVNYLIATDVAARGLDIAQMPVVVNMDLPMVAQDYIHRIGRTGRAGESGVAVSLVSADEVELLLAIEQLQGRSFARLEEPGFVAEHRVPATDLRLGVKKKPKKAKVKTAIDDPSSRIHLGDALADSAPKIKNVRSRPNFLSGANKKR